MNKETHDSRDSKRGDYYQALVAVEYAINDQFNDFEELVIEHHGDVTFDETIQIEVKHHKNKTSLGDTHEDFWKTLYNWVNQKKYFEKLVLHTTAHFPKANSKLKKWNTEDAKGRFKILQAIKFSHSLAKIKDYKISDRSLEILLKKGICFDTITKLKQSKNKKYSKTNFEKFLKEKEIVADEQLILIKECKDTTAKKYKTWDYNRYITSFKFDELEALLQKIKINTEQPNDVDLIDKISRTSVFKSLPCNRKEDLFEIIKERLAGKIQAKVAGDKKWAINNEQFFNAIKQSGKDYYDETYLSVFDKYMTAQIPDDVKPKFREKRFVEQLTSINCEREGIEDAIIDTWKTIELLGEETKRNPFFYEDEYLPYKSEVVLKNVKNKVRRIKKSDNIIERKENSLLFYYDMVDMNVPDYKSIKSVYAYFKHGTMQNLVEENEFSWVL